WVRSVKEECLSKVILLGERCLRRALNEFVEYYHAERNHQGRGNVLLFPRETDVRREGPVPCRGRLGGLLRYYHQEAAKNRAPKVQSPTLTPPLRSRDRGSPRNTLCYSVVSTQALG
ncbi:MAG TPA: hypothetical protein VKE24_02990, partial [Candidatus Acidoferrales bacterium]|nr:hypothetical protein [Candidatus Acidoferrales bacterium]